MTFIPSIYDQRSQPQKASEPDPLAVDKALEALDAAYARASKVDLVFNPMPLWYCRAVKERVPTLTRKQAIALVEHACGALQAWEGSTPAERRGVRGPDAFDLRPAREARARDIAAGAKSATDLEFNAAAFLAGCRKGGWVIELSHGGANLRVVEPKGRAVAPALIEATLSTISRYKAALIDALWLEAAKPGVTAAGGRVI